MRGNRPKDDEMLELLKMMAPGTSLREGLENILKARTGGFIVIGDSSEVMSMVDGGFFINKEYSPAHLYELAKMDGAIIISKDLRKILYANALLIPNPSITTDETGTRHRSAERVAKQTGEIVVCISQRRNIITLYKGPIKYILRDTATILTRANQALQTLEKYKAVLDGSLNNLTVLEFEDVVTLDDVAFVIQRTEMVMRIVAEIDRYICELGNEGRLVSMQLEELLSNVEEDGLLVTEDYKAQNDERRAEDIMRQVSAFSYEELMDLTSICRALGYSGGVNTLDLNVSPKGFRIMNRIPRVPMTVIKNLLDKFNNLQGILRASLDDLDTVEGIGEVRARMIKEGLKKAQEQLFLDNRHY
ncbi:MAG: DNA integrity scanning diadenylate cyclase DisA [Clostridia bacterium]|nr:DNA integrity scanning diadenylate cyclase DisA [Clostridia bacterium]